MMKEPLWKPSADQIHHANMTRFIGDVNHKYGKQMDDYRTLYQWSIDNIPEFWATLWEFAGVKASKGYDAVVEDLAKMPGAEWFVGARLNFAENLLRYRDDRVALVFKGEDRFPARMTYRELYELVAGLSNSLRAAGVGPGDRVAGFLPNMIESVAAMLATTSIGAAWSSCSPDFGMRAILDRFGQIEPKILFCADGYFYNGRRFDSLGRIGEVMKQLPSIEKVVIVPYVQERPDIRSLSSAELFDEFARKEKGLSIDFEQVPSDHPLYVMYSSGTTGLPKCMVQGVAGILLNHLKELVLHTDMKREDTIFYFTTTGWMMWNWLVTSLAVGATVVLYDGSPFFPNTETLWELAEDEGVTVFGTSARYIAALQKANAKPRRNHDLSRIRAILSTGSPLSKDGFEYVYREVKGDLQLASISGGTDLNGCFALGNPIGPVYPGELQCRGLGLRVEIFDACGRAVIGKRGELVCTSPFPSMPLYFWDDPDGSKYRTAYFEVYPNVWRHGDFAEITETGGVVIFGRSDATLKPSGVRIGTADIYRVVELLEEIADSIVVGQEWENDVRVILFVKITHGVELNESLIQTIKAAIRENTTPRHVPAKIIAVKDIPYTRNMKKVELAVKNVIHGREVSNRDALVNPESLELYKDLPELRR